MSCPTTEWQFLCPACRQTLTLSGSSALGCGACGEIFRCEEGVWRMLGAERQAAYAEFIRDYDYIRCAEGRGSANPDFYRALPYQDLSGVMPRDWAVRSASFQAFLNRVIRPLENQVGIPLSVLDLGAGNCWLAYRLAQRGHKLAAVDLRLNELDGLGAHVHYPVGFVPIQAEFDHLPLADSQADLAVFNASFHYSSDYHQTLVEARRVLQPQGRVVILDSPVYTDPSSGVRMVAERREQFRREFGIASDRLHSEEYLTFSRLEQLGRDLEMDWRSFRPPYSLRRRLQPWIAKLRGRREPARFLVVVGRFRTETTPRQDSDARL